MAPVALVTGVAGQDGGYLAELLLGRGWQVHGLVRPGTPPSRVATGVQVHEGDLADPGLPSRLVAATQPDVVHHLAGMSSVARSWHEPAETAELTGAAVARLLQACFADGGARRVVLAGSGEVFAGSARTPQDESTPMAPRSPYGAAKAYVRHLGEVYREAGHHVSTALLYNHESPRRPDRFVTTKIAAGAVAVARGGSEGLTLGNLDAVRDWGWAPEYVDAMVRMAAQERPADLVVATGVACSVRQFVAAAFAAAGLPDWEAHVRTDPALLRRHDAARLVGDASAARRVLGWVPTVAGEQVAAELVRARLGRRPEDGRRA